MARLSFPWPQKFAETLLASGVLLLATFCGPNAADGDDSTGAGNSGSVSVSAGSNATTGSSGTTGTGGASPQDPIPNLPAGQHLGTFVSYETLPAQTATAAASRMAEARSAGMAISRIHLSWSALEPSPQSFDLEQLHEALAQVPAEDAILVLIETIDSEGFELPPDLVDPNSPYLLANGRKLGDPEVTGRFAQLLAQVLPVLASRKVMAISVGNEPDNYYSDVDHASADGLAWQSELVKFLQAARSEIRAVLPSMPVAMTVTQITMELNRTAGIADVIAAGDVAVFNYYCQDAAFQVQPAQIVALEIGEMITAAQGRPVLLQELGCPAGRPPSMLGATVAAQAAFLNEVATQMAARPELRAAFWFLLVDWSPDLAAMVRQSLEDEGFPELAAQYEEVLRSAGLINYENGAERQAWSTFRDAVAALRQ